MFEMGKAVERSIGGHLFFIRPIPPFEAIALMGEMQRLIGPAAGRMIASIFGGHRVGTGLLDREINGTLLAEGFESLAQHVNGSNLQAVIRAILNPQYISVRISGTSQPVRLEDGTVNQLFTANLGDLMSLVGAVLEVTYGDFFGKLAALSGSLGGLVQTSNSPAPSVPT